MDDSGLKKTQVDEVVLVGGSTRIPKVQALITDDPAEAKAAGEALWAVTKDAEKKMKDAQDEEERAKAEAEAGEKADDEDDEDLDDLDEEEEDEIKEGEDEDAEGHDEL